MSAFINTADVIGDIETCKQILEGTITEYAENRVSSVGIRAFYGCSALTAVDLPAAKNFGANAFRNCSKLSTVILRKSSLTTLENMYVLSGTPIASGTGYIYVPATLVDSYKSASGWSTYANQFRALEDYTVDGTTTGALDPSKI